MEYRRTGLVEKRHAFPEDEREILQAVLARIRGHFVVADRSLRDTYDVLMEDTPIAEGVTFSAVDHEEFPGWWVRAGQAHDVGRAIFYLHGGGYHSGSARAYRGFVSQIVARTGVDAFIFDYPLAPEHPFPAAYEAALAALRWLATQGVGQTAIVGDSAGGGLALATASGAELTIPAIIAIVVFSPYVDLAFRGSSYRDPNTRDLILQAEPMAMRAAAYLNGADPMDGRASPLYSVPRSLPPLAIQVGLDELLLDDSRRYATTAAERGGVVHLDIYEELHHVFQIAVGDLPSADRALNDVATFLSRHWQPVQPQKPAAGEL